jgi:hypothetical protein
MNIQDKAQSITENLLMSKAEAYNLHLLLDAINIEAEGLDEIVLKSQTAKRLLALTAMAHGFPVSNVFIESVFLCLVEDNAERLLAKALERMVETQTKKEEAGLV